MAGVWLRSDRSWWWWWLGVHRMCASLRFAGHCFCTGTSLSRSTAHACFRVFHNWCRAQVLRTWDAPVFKHTQHECCSCCDAWPGCLMPSVLV